MTQKIIDEKNPKWAHNKGQKRKILRETKWEDKHIEKIIIFEDIIFSGTTAEGKIIWGEIHEHMVYQLSGVIQNPLVWMIRYRFWINSRYLAKTLGLKNYGESEIKGKSI